MKNILEHYQSLPLRIDPIAFSIGPFSIGWYSIMYLVALGVVCLLLSYRIKMDLSDEEAADFRSKPQSLDGRNLSKKRFKEVIVDFLLISFISAIIGGRLGYIFLYNPSYYLHHLAETVSPYDFSTGRFIGIYGMSYHGGLVGVVAGAWLFVRKQRLDFWKFADFVVPAIPAGYFFGRIGNFLNVELFGRVTDWRIGMYFPLSSGSGGFLRFPSQLLEAILEGAVLFIVLWTVRNKDAFPGYLAALYLIGYGSARFAAEFFREPDVQIGYIMSYFTLGQIFSMMMIFSGCCICHFQKRRKIV